MNTAKLPVASPQAKADSYVRLSRATLLGQSSVASLRAAQGDPPPAPASMQRGKPVFPLDYADIAGSNVALLRNDGARRKSTLELVEEARQTLTINWSLMQSKNDLALAAIAKRPTSEQTVIRSASINLGQLDIAGIIKVKHATQRREFYNTVLAELLHGRAGRADQRGGVMAPSGPPDVIQCQEVWIPAAQVALRKAAEDNGYICVFPDKQMTSYGLQLLIRKRPDFKRIVEQGIIELKDEDGWSLRASFDRIWGSHRGLAYAIIELKNGEKVLVSTTHLNPLSDYEPLRARQFEAMTKIFNALSARVSYSLHGSDLNTVETTEGVDPGGVHNAAAGVIAMHKFMRAIGHSDAWAAVDSKDKGGTMNHHFRQALGKEYDLRGRRIDYQLAGAMQQGKLLGALAYRTLLGDLYPLGDGTTKAFSDHLMVETTYVLA